MRKNSIDINKILIETRETLMNPKEYFPSMSLTGGFAEPVIKAAVYGVVAGIFALIWSKLGLTALGEVGMLGGAIGLMALIWSIILAMITVFIGGAIMLVISGICGGITDYEANVRVAAALMAIYPINAFFSFFYGINFNLGGLTGLAVSLWSIYLIYLASIMALKGRESTAKIVAMVLLVLSLIGYWGGRKANQSFDDISDEYQFEQLD